MKCKKPPGNSPEATLHHIQIFRQIYYVANSTICQYIYFWFAFAVLIDDTSIALKDLHFDSRKLYCSVEI